MSTEGWNPKHYQPQPGSRWCPQAFQCAHPVHPLPQERKSRCYRGTLSTATKAPPFLGASKPRRQRRWYNQPQLRRGHSGSCQAEQTSRGGREGRKGRAVLPSKPLRPSGTHLHPAADAGPRSPSSLWGELGLSRNGSPPPGVAEGCPPWGEGADNRENSSPSKGRVGWAWTSPHLAPPPPQRLPAQLPRGGLGPGYTSHPPVVARERQVPTGAREAQRALVTWLKPCPARHLNVLPWLGGAVVLVSCGSVAAGDAAVPVVSLTAQPGLFVLCVVGSPTRYRSDAPFQEGLGPGGGGMRCRCSSDAPLNLWSKAVTESAEGVFLKKLRCCGRCQEGLMCDFFCCAP